MYGIIKFKNKTQGQCFAWLYKCVTFTGHVSDESNEDNDLSTGSAVAISVVATFIITLVITAVMTYIITRMHYKYWYERNKHSDHSRPPVEREADITEDGPYNGTTIKMETNPAYATTNYWVEFTTHYVTFKTFFWLHFRNLVFDHSYCFCGQCHLEYHWQYMHEQLWIT